MVRSWDTRTARSSEGNTKCPQLQAAVPQCELVEVPKGQTLGSHNETAQNDDVNGIKMDIAKKN